MDGSSSHPTVVVVVDPHCGDHLHEIIGTSPAWVTMSEANAPTVREIWAKTPEADHLSGVTGFDQVASISPECCFLDQLEAIDLHHGPYSSRRLDTGLRVVGASFTDEVRTALADLGFAIIGSDAAGFTVSRSDEAARMIRE